MVIAKENETRRMYEKNLSLLTPWLRETAEKIGEEALWRRVKVRYNGEGYPVCVYQKDGREFHITGQNPVEEAAAWGKTFGYQGVGAVFLYGAGFGYPIFELFAHKTAHTLVVVFEQDLYLFKAMLYYFDFEPVVKSGRIVFLIGSPEYYAAAFEEIYLSVNFIICTCPVAAWTHAVRRSFKREYIAIHQDVFAKLSLMSFYMGNDHKDNLTGFLNLLGNVREILENPGAGCLKDQFRGYPAFIVSNGPSLDKNMHWLKKIKGRGLMLCAESAILPLLRNGITPDAVVVIERTKATYTCHFRDIDYPPGVALLALAVADPRVFPSFKGQKIPLLRAKETPNIWLGEYFGDGHMIDTGANVAHLAMEMAAFMGADPIIFAGQDYAYGKDDQTHSSASIYAGESGRKARERLSALPTVYLEGNDGKPVRSNMLWADFKQGMEQKIACHPGIDFINATEGGAKISGTRLMKLEQAIGDYCKKPMTRRIHEIAAEHRQRISPEQKKERLKSFRENLEAYAGLFLSLSRESAAAGLACKKTLLLSEGE